MKPIKATEEVGRKNSRFYEDLDMRYMKAWSRGSTEISWTGHVFSRDNSSNTQDDGNGAHDVYS
jgi:hypothetical protein